MPPTPVIDADAHITEPPDVFTARLPSKYVEQAPTVVRDQDGDDVWVMNGHHLIRLGTTAIGIWSDFPNSIPRTLEDVLPATYSADARLQYMDEAAIWAQVLYPNVAGFGAQAFLTVEDEALKLLCVEAYNDFLYEFCSADPRRLIGVIALPFWDVNAAVHEIERNAERGMRGALFTGEPQRFGFPLLGDRHWDPLYSATQAAGMPIHFHLGGGESDAVFAKVSRNVSQERSEVHGRAGSSVFTTCELYFKNAIQCSDLLGSGVLPRFPDLKFVSVETGIGWIPFLLESADWAYKLSTRPAIERYTTRPDEDELLPSELFARQVYATYWFEFVAPTYLRQSLPIDNIMFETDFPHVASLYGNIQEVIAAELKDTPEDVRRKFLWENAARLYRIPNPPASWQPWADGETTASGPKVHSRDDNAQR
jgi:predicted TIM-barrel fold metal-dependent hydrolase